MAREMVKSDVPGLVNTLTDSPKDEAWAAGVRVLIDDLKSSDPESAKSWQDLLDNSGIPETQ